MNDSNLILFHWKKSQQTINKNLDILRQHSDKEAVHDIRVAIKKLRACLNLYIHLKQEPEWEYLLDKTRMLFRVLGRQRDVEVCLELVPVYEKEAGSHYKEFSVYLQGLLKKTQAWTRKALYQFPKKELAKAALLFRQDPDLSTNEPILPRILSIIDEHFSELSKYLKQPHKVRQLLKEIFYWIHMLPPNDAILQSYHGKELHQLLDELGSWQDQEALLAKVKHFRKDYLPHPFPEYLSLKMLESKLKEKKEKLVSDLLQKTRRLLEKIPKPIPEKSDP